MRLNQYIARAGMASRRGADELIQEGQVFVNGKVAELGMEIDPETDKVEIGKSTVKIREGFVYVMLNKPKGYTSTVKDKFAQRTVMELVPRNPRIFPVGRLDRDSEGLLLLTNDGDLANALMHPSHHVPKLYHVSIIGKIGAASVSKLTGGLRLEEGIAKAKIRLLREEPGGVSVVEFILFQGFNRQIRRMCEAVGWKVKKLVRMKIGELVLGDLPRGKWRYLTDKERDTLKRSVR